MKKELPEQLICLSSPMVEIINWQIPTIDIITNKNPSCGNKLGDHYHQDLWHVPPRLFLDPKKLAVTWHRVVAISGVVLCANICVKNILNIILLLYIYWICILNIEVYISIPTWGDNPVQCIVSQLLPATVLLLRNLNISQQQKYGQKNKKDVWT